MRDQRKVFRGIVASVLLLAGLAGGFAQASSDALSHRPCTTAPICGSGGGGSGEVPTPFDALNQRVELADGESYILIGNVVLMPFEGGTGERWKAYFEVDLNEHPWLASEKRRKNPFYVLEGSVNYWKQFRGMRIRLSCEAQGAVVTPEGAAPEYVIQLKRARQGSVVPLGLARPPFHFEGH